MSTASLLQVDGLQAGYGKSNVLHGVSLQVRAGSVVTVIGPNGAGKSTLLGALMGTLPCRGSILYDGVHVETMSLEERVMAGIALVPERRELFTTMTVEDNLVLGGWRPRALRMTDWRDTLGQVYELFPRLEERRLQRAGTLSGGERQMLAIGRALMGRPRLLMLDEPSLGLAPRIVRDIFVIVERLRESGVTVLLVEQNARAALEVAQHGYVLETGEVVAEGAAAQLATDARVIETYLGSRREVLA